MPVVGADIGGHHIAAALVDIDSNRIVAGSYRHRETHPKATKDALLTDWAGLLGEVAGSVAGAVAGIGIAMPGPFDYARGTAWFESNSKFETLYGVDVRAELDARTGLDGGIRFLNDATSFAVGCHRAEAAGRPGRLVGVTLGTGLGGAFLEDGIPVIAGESVPPGGCLWDLPYKASIADDYVSARWLLAAARDRLGLSADGVAQVAAHARGSAEARAIFADYGANLGAVVAPWLARFGGDMLVLGGRITGAFDLFAPALEAALAEHGCAVPLAVHENTEDAAIIGAAATFDETFWARARGRLPER